MSKHRYGDYKAEISKHELSDYDIIAFEGEIICVEAVEDVIAAVAYLEDFNILGFDTETRPSFKKGKINSVSLLQLSAGNRAYLFRLKATGLPQQLVSILTNPEILKVGVAIHDDIKALQTLSGFTPAGFIELQEMVKEYGIINSGLKKLSAIILGSTISKRQQVSNWENPVLSQAQKVYAATDAWVSLKIYKRLINSRTVKAKGKQNGAEEAKAKQNGAEETKAKQTGAEEAKAKQDRTVKAKAKQTGAEEAKAKQNGAEETKAKQDRTVKAKAKQGRTVKAKAKQNGAEETKAKQDRTVKQKGKQNGAEEAKAKQGRTVKAKAKQNGAEETKAKGSTLVTERLKGSNPLKEKGNGNS